MELCPCQETFNRAVQPNSVCVMQQIILVSYNYSKYAFLFPVSGGTVLPLIEKITNLFLHIHDKELLYSFMYAVSAHFPAAIYAQLLFSVLFITSDLFMPILKNMDNHFMLSSLVKWLHNSSLLTNCSILLSIIEVLIVFNNPQFYSIIVFFLSALSFYHNSLVPIVFYLIHYQFFHPNCCFAFIFTGIWFSVSSTLFEFFNFFFLRLGIVTTPYFSVYYFSH